MCSFDISRTSSSYLNYSGDDSSAISSEESSQISIPSNQGLFTIEEKRNQKHRQRLYLDKLERERREEAASEKTSQVIRQNAIKRRRNKMEEEEKKDPHFHPHSQDGCHSSSSHREDLHDVALNYSNKESDIAIARPANEDASCEVATESIQIVDKHEERKKKRKATISTSIQILLSCRKVGGYWCFDCNGYCCSSHSNCSCQQEVC